MQIISKHSPSVGYFERQQVVKRPPIPIRERMAVCPTVQSYLPLWGTIDHVESPGPTELVHFKANSQAQQATAADQLQRMGQQARLLIDEHLLATGNMLLQGLPSTNPEACEAFVSGLGYTQQKYEPAAGAARQKIGSLDAATNVGPAELLDLHNEMCYNPRPNKKIILICLNPAKEGGESLLGDSAAIAAAMPEFVLQRFADHGGVRYTRRYKTAEASRSDPPEGPAAPTWQEHTGFDDPEAAAGFFKDRGFKVEWKSGGELVATHVAPAVVPHPATGQPVWFNICHLAAPGLMDYADGTPIEPDTVQAIRAARLSATRALKLGPGDVLVMDNYRAAHGRLPYSGSERVVVAVLTSD